MTIFQYLNAIKEIKDAPIDSYIINDMNGRSGGLFYVFKHNYKKFVEFFLQHSGDDYHLTLNLAFAQEHALMFDLDFKYNDNIRYNPENFKFYIDRFLIPVVKSFFHQLPCFTMISTFRQNGGLHIHLPEFYISHDDYIILLTKLQPQLNRCFTKFSVTLDIPTHFTLAKSSKPGNSAYIPFNIEYFENDNNKNFVPLYEEFEFESHINITRKKFKLKKINTNAIFRELLPYSYNLFLERINYYLMPIVLKDKNELTPICYLTYIGHNKQSNYEIIAEFTYKGREQYEISKSINAKFKSTDFLKTIRFINNNSTKMKNFKSENYALNQWYKYFKENSIVSKDKFEEINSIIKQNNENLRHQIHPIKTIMEYNNYYFALPMFLSLYKIFDNMKSDELILHLRDILPVSRFLTKLEDVNDTIIKAISNDFTINTILYCASNISDINKMKHEKFGDKLINIINDNKKSIELISSDDNFAKFILKIINQYSPIIYIKLKHSCKKPLRYYWNIMREQWQEVLTDNDIKNIIINIRLKIKQCFLGTEFQNKIDDFYKHVDITTILGVILSESSMDIVTIQMDRHKWFIKTENGILDLLTGHVGGIVPEFYMSDSSMDLGLSREELMNIRTDEKLINIYEELTSKTFFNEYLKQLFLDLTDDFYDTLKEVAKKKDIYDTNNSIGISMLKFYMHLCKYMSFEYEQFMYMLDVLSSLLIATNYCRHFFILQGVTGNGKSKFFEMIARVFCTYSQAIRNVNLQSSKAISAQSEMASSLFKKRIIVIEELSGKLDENLVKELTGDSQTSFRNLYEQNLGGKPTAKLFASTNNTPICTATEAFRARVITFPFNSTFVDFKNTLKTSEQVEHDKYKLERGDFIVDETFLGFFGLIYIHLFKNIRYEDGYLDLRPEPINMREFKEHYLSMTSLYKQFKQYVDVQSLTGELTTVGDLLSAIRQFLVETKRVGTVKDEEIVIKFDEEYGHLKKAKTHDSIFEMSPLDISDEENDSEIDDDEGEIPKKKKKATSIIYYENIFIRNLKKSK